MLLTATPVRQVEHPQTALPLDDVSPTASAYARDQFPHDAHLQHQFAQAMTLLEHTTDGARIAKRLEHDNIRIATSGVEQGFAAEYIMPFTRGNFGESLQALFTSHPWPHVININTDIVDSPEQLAGIIAHEGAHYDLAKHHAQNISIRIGASLTTALSELVSLPTLGMMDITGSFHKPGLGAVAAASQGSTIVTAMTHENYAYRVGGSVDRQLRGGTFDFVYRPDGTVRSWGDSGWQIADRYMQQVTLNTTGDDIGESSPVRTALASAAGLGLGLGIRALLKRRFGMSSLKASLLTYGPGLIAMTGAILLSQSRHTSSAPHHARRAA